MYPIFVDLHSRLCVVVGGGHVAERKVQGILAHGGKIRLISPEVTSELAEMIHEHRLEWRNRYYEPGDLAGAFLVFAATSSPKTQEQIRRQGEAQGVLVNLADSPEQSGFHVPASFTRKDLCVTVSTHGKSPAMAAMVKRMLEQDIGPEYGVLLQLMSQIREAVLAASTYEGEKEPRDLFHAILQPEMLLWIKSGQWGKVREHVSTIVGTTPDIDWDVFTQDTL
ncbi:MAG: siroheme synthase [Desulfobulbus propionicus]|nr:MAG: siroheme synthase [Desulfobulbus propionicus]